MKRQKISVITINYNNKTGLEKTIKSVISQTYPELEYIIIDGGSNDGSVDVIKKYADKITYWVSEPDKGIYNAMNKGIIKATGEYCNFMNSGDCFYDSNVLNCVFQTNQTADVLTGIAKTENGLWIPVTNEKLSLYHFYVSGLSHQATFIKTILQKKLQYDEKLSIVADSKFFIQALILHNASYLTLPYYICLYAPGGISSNIEKHRLELDMVFHELFPERILKDYKQLFLLKSNFILMKLQKVIDKKFFSKTIDVLRRIKSI